eukprot:scaffold125398_cov29-Prasinocladus_malaysianus.AAC.1
MSTPVKTARLSRVLSSQHSPSRPNVRRLALTTAAVGRVHPGTSRTALQPVTSRRPSRRRSVSTDQRNVDTSPDKEEPPEQTNVEEQVSNDTFSWREQWYPIIPPRVSAPVDIEIKYG